MERKEKDGKNSSATFRVGAVALVFMVIGYQVALFVFRASATAIVAHRDRPDTVYVVDPGLAGSIIAGMGCPADSFSGRTRSGDCGAAVQVRSAAHAPVAEGVARKYGERKYESFRFNPNTVPVDDLCRLGFSEKQASAIDNYRKKGGRFRRKEDFARSFVVADSVFKRLEPFIDIPLLDINSADSTEFDTLPGIGPFFAAKMMEHRKALGGYSYPEQLMDIWKFDADKYDGLRDLIMVGPSEPFRLWSLPEDSLKLHPYIRSYAAHGITLFRDNSPEKDWTVDNLVKAGILKKEDGDRLARCRIAAP